MYTFFRVKCEESFISISAVYQKFFEFNSNFRRKCKTLRKLRLTAIFAIVTKNYDFKRVFVHTLNNKVKLIIVFRIVCFIMALKLDISKHLNTVLRSSGPKQWPMVSYMCSLSKNNFWIHKTALCERFHKNLKNRTKILYKI